MVLSPQFKLFAHSPDGTVQAPLFASPREIMQSKPVLGDVLPQSAWRVDPENVASDGYETFKSIQGRKLAEARDTRLYSNIRDHGVQEPLKVAAMPPHALDEPEAGPYLHVIDGHHRLFSALETRPDDHILLNYEDREDSIKTYKSWGKPRRYPGQQHTAP
jgi:hypothetical protein